MAVSDWSTNPVENTSLGGYNLSGPYGQMFAELMAQIKAAMNGENSEIGAWTNEERTTTVKAAIETLETAMGSWTAATPARTTTVKAAIEAVEAEIGTWTDETETTTVKAAIEDLRPDDGAGD